MQHLPESISDAINTSELGALIAEHRNALLCELLRPMLDTLDREGIQLSAVLRALATIASDRSGQLETSNGSNPWERCNKLLHQARASAEEAERLSRNKIRYTARSPQTAHANGTAGTSNGSTLDLRDVRVAIEDANDEEAWTRELIAD
ncbi:MAG: hypothetical protein EA001_12410 [Oscillatoriales cyanobacterium]|nr:MAG: hypothetical protein EA001_12410 [Oscillatoriales cyanobacterium]